MNHKYAVLCLVFSLTLGIAILSGCALSFQPKDPKNSPVTSNLPSAVAEPELVKVQFVAQPFQKFSEEDEISLDILDLVSGVSYNLERYLLHKSGDNHILNVDLPEGATIAYRYTLTSPIEVTETLPDGSALPFRQLVVRKNLVVNDVISGWPELAYNRPTVDLNGVVVDDKTEAPLPDVLINVAGKTALTDMNGRFFIRGLAVGKHNLVATLSDGSYMSFQQEVNMVENLATLAIIRMTPLPQVTLTFIMSPPNEAVGAPVRMAGNLRQFGQTYSDMLKGAGAQAVNMPLMSRDSDGNYVAQLNLYAGSLIRYQYTLGDALVNTERTLDGNRNVRQFIVPNKDLVVEDSVTTWRTQLKNAIPFYATEPGNATTDDQVYIQFNLGAWSNPIPMWLMENNQWMTIYNPRAVDGEEVAYRYCRNADCQFGEEDYSNTTPRSVTIGTISEVHDSISGWRMWEPDAASPSNYSPTRFDEEALVGVELDSAFASNYLNSSFGLAEQLKSKGFNWLILTPTWKVGINKDLPFIDSDPLNTIPSTELNRIAMAAQQAGLKVALYPQLSFPSDSDAWWNDTVKSMIWWQQWYADYERMVMHSIKLATAIKADQLILGGPDVSYSYPGVMETIGENFGTPKTSEKIWTDLLTKADEYYDGAILLAQEVDAGALRDYSFYQQTQGFYLLFSSDLENYTSYTADTVGSFIDNIVLPFYDSYQKPVYFGLNAASFTTTDINFSNRSGSIISSTNPAYDSHNVNLEAQTQFYSAYLDAISARGWISGLAARGFFPTMKMTDFSSSIYGKPAFQLFQDQ